MLVVTTANSDRDLVTLQAVKAEVGDTGINDDQIMAFITQASGIIAEHCGRTFQLETVTETFVRHSSCGDILLSRYPVTEIVSLNADGADVAASDYHLDGATGALLNTGAGWWIGRVVVTYKAGYDLPAGTPQGVRRACIDMVAGLIAATASDQPANLRAETVEGVGSKEFFNTSAGATLTTDIEALLDPHCKPNL